MSDNDIVYAVYVYSKSYSVPIGSFYITSNDLAENEYDSKQAFSSLYAKWLVENGYSGSSGLETVFKVW